jgi:hypothetical protein
MRLPTPCLMVLAACLPAACSSAPEPAAELPVPAITMQAGWIKGTAVGGPVRPSVPGQKPFPASTVAVTSYTLKLADADDASLGASAELIARPGAANLLAATPSILPGARLTTGDAARQRLDALERLAAETPVADRFAAFPPPMRLPLLQGITTLVAVKLDLTEPPQSLLLHLRIEKDSPTTARVALRSTTADDGTEIVLLREPLLESGTPLLLHLPFGAGLTLVLQLLPDQPTEEAIRMIRRHASGSRPMTQLQPAQLDSEIHRQQVEATKSVIGARSRRAALIALADRLGAFRLADLALIADDRTLIQLCDGLPADLAQRPPATAALTLELLAFAVVGPLLRDLDLPPAVQTWARRHAGAVGRSQASLQRALLDCHDLEQLQLRIRNGNLAALDDGDPGQRLTAHDWLQGQGMTIAGYDPLADRVSRNRSLARAMRRIERTEQRGR